MLKFVKKTQKSENLENSEKFGQIYMNIFENMK